MDSFLSELLRDLLTHVLGFVGKIVIWGLSFGKVRVESISRGAQKPLFVKQGGFWTVKREVAVLAGLTAVVAAIVFAVVCLGEASK